MLLYYSYISDYVRAGVQPYTVEDLLWHQHRQSVCHARSAAEELASANRQQRACNIRQLRVCLR